MTWTITDTYFPDRMIENGNKYLTANGYMGYRGTLEEYGKEQFCAVNILGVYDQVGINGENQSMRPIHWPSNYLLIINLLVC